MTSRTNRPRIPALDPALTRTRPSSADIRHREALRPGIHFTPDDRRLEVVRMYPELDQVCDELGIPPDGAVADSSEGAPWSLHALAISALPPYHWSPAIPAAIADLVHELRDIHHPALRCEITRLDLLITTQTDRHYAMDLRTLRCGWEIFRDVMLDHLHEEEQDCFPVCLSLDAQRTHPPLSGTHCAQLLATMIESHSQALTSLQEMLVLARRASVTVTDPDLAVVVRGLEAMRDALVIHTDWEGNRLLPLCLRIALSIIPPAATVD